VFAFFAKGPRSKSHFKHGYFMRTSLVMLLLSIGSDIVLV